jgi:membrane protein DedA with SNARE-associated domain
VFRGRLTPLVHSFISYPAGASESPLGSYSALTLAGSAILCFAFAGEGWALGTRYDSVHDAFTGAEVAIVVGGRLLLRRRRRVRA